MVKTETVNVRLRDDRDVSLTREALKRALEQMSDRGRNFTFTTNDEGRVEALRLVAEALGVEVEELRPTQALAALQELDLPTEEAGSDSHPATSEDETIADLRQVFGRELHRLRGRWVAIQSGRVIADDVDLAGVLRVTGSEVATVLYVPANGVTDALPGDQ
ncbi:hypothetical protein DEI93_16010 [Curtobacterium sp. MCBD17_035]|uniref:hypothetical protein n=1 Tax=Curtobacterium sp. MCBD17_035 TaxID=2175673 RepID=UPI0011B7BDED|nr:hypothetical protein [Curtobacterium sp. MCBD17_035]WIB67434.1 hypothetical protein DEI93_16010 [Curtobacterium sp. MCBD17_035]